MTTSPRFDVLALGAINPLSQDDRAIVYAAPGITVPGVAAPAYREYRRAALAGVDAGALAAMCDHLAALPPAAAADLLAVAAWPCGLVQSAGAIRGVVVPAAPDGFVPLADGVIAATSATDRPAYAWLASTAGALVTLHRHDIVAGDLLTAGLLVPGLGGQGVFFAGADRMLLRGASPSAPEEAPGWEIGASHPDEEPRTQQSDVFKLGLLVLRVLTGDAASRDPGALPPGVPAELRQLVQAAIGGTPGDRPAPVDWLAAIDEAAAVASGRPGRPSRSPARAPATPVVRPPSPTLAKPGDEGAGKPLPSAPLPSPTGDDADWWRRPAVTVGAAVGAVVLLGSAIAVASGGGDGKTLSVRSDDVGVDADPTTTVGRTTRTTRARTTTTERTTTTTTLATVDGWFHPAVPDDCGLSTAALAGGERATVECSESWQVMDLTTGDVTSVAKGTSANGADLADAIVGESYLWWDVTDVPATGLEPPSRTFTLRSRDIAGGDPKELMVLEGDEYAEVTITGAWGPRLLSYEKLSKDEASFQVLRDAEGAEITRFESSASYGSFPMDGIFDAGDVSIDLTTDETVTVDTGSIDEGFDPCAQAGVVNAWSEPAIVRRGPEGLREGSAVPVIEHFGARSVGSGDRLFGGGPSGGLAAYDLHGTLLWELPYEVARSWSVFGGIPFVTNASEEIVAVDPTTGQEATVSAELLEAATVHMRSGEIDMDIDSATGNVLLYDYERGLKLVTLPECKVR